MEVVCLCECGDQGASPTLPVFVNFQSLSTIIHRLSSINSWLITRWTYKQLVQRLISQNSYQQSITDNELIVDKVVLLKRIPIVDSTGGVGDSVTGRRTGGNVSTEEQGSFRG